MKHPILAVIGTIGMVVGGILTAVHHEQIGFIVGMPCAILLAASLAIMHNKIQNG